jgi:hypothetical protein
MRAQMIRQSKENRCRRLNLRQPSDQSGALVTQVSAAFIHSNKVSPARAWAPRYVRMEILDGGCKLIVSFR